MRTRRSASPFSIDAKPLPQPKHANMHLAIAMYKKFPQFRCREASCAGPLPRPVQTESGRDDITPRCKTSALQEPVPDASHMTYQLFSCIDGPTGAYLGQSTIHEHVFNYLQLERGSDRAAAASSTAPVQLPFTANVIHQLARTLPVAAAPNHFSTAAGSTPTRPHVHKPAICPTPTAGGKRDELHSLIGVGTPGS